VKSNFSLIDIHYDEIPYVNIVGVAVPTYIYVYLPLSEQLSLFEGVHLITTIVAERKRIIIRSD
jgi:hypothetical protein